MWNHLRNSALVLCLALSACTTTVTRPDGTVEAQKPNLDMIRLMASASVAAWAAAANGIKPDDAQALTTILDTILNFHADGTPIDPAHWMPAIQRDVPKRYQGLAMVMVELVAYQLKKYDLSSVIPEPGSDAWKILEAIQAGAKSGLAPYLEQGA